MDDGGGKRKISYKKIGRTFLYDDNIPYAENPSSNLGLAIESRLSLLSPLKFDFELDPNPILFLDRLEIELADKIFEKHRVNSSKKTIMISLLGSEKLKTYPLYPNNSDVYIDYKIKNHQELQLPLTSTQIKSEGEENILIFKFQEREIIHLHSSALMNNFIKFILQNANGVKIADILLNLKIPLIKDLEDTSAKVEQINASKALILKETEELISTLLRTQISK